MRRAFILSIWLVGCGPVTPPPPPNPTVVALKLRPPTPVLAVGRRIQIVAEANAENGQSFDQNELVAWSVSDATKASINELGQVKGLAAGRIDVKAVHPHGPEASVAVDIIASDVDRVVVAPASLRFQIGNAQPLTATAKLASGVDEDVSSRAAWASNNVGVAKVSMAGLVTCFSVGQVTIGATFLGVRGVASVVCE